MLARIYEQCAAYPADAAAATIRRQIEGFIRVAKLLPAEQVRAEVREIESAIASSVTMYASRAGRMDYMSRESGKRKRRDSDKDGGGTAKRRKQVEPEPVIEFNSGAVVPTDVLADILSKLSLLSANEVIGRVGLAVNRETRAALQESAPMPDSVSADSIRPGSLLNTWKVSRIVVRRVEDLKPRRGMTSLTVVLNEEPWAPLDHEIVFDDVITFKVDYYDFQRCEMFWENVMPRLRFPKAIKLELTGENWVQLDAALLDGVMPKLETFNGFRILLRGISPHTARRLQEFDGVALQTQASAVPAIYSSLHTLTLSTPVEDEASLPETLQPIDSVFRVDLFPKLRVLKLHGRNDLSVDGTFNALELVIAENCFTGEMVKYKTAVPSVYSPHPEFRIEFDDMAYSDGYVGGAIQRLNECARLPNLTSISVLAPGYPLDAWYDSIVVSTERMPMLRHLKADYEDVNYEKVAPHASVFEFVGTGEDGKLETYDDIPRNIPAWVLAQPGLKRLLCPRWSGGLPNRAAPFLIPGTIALGITPDNIAENLPCLFPNVKHVVLRAQQMALISTSFVWKSVQSLVILASVSDVRSYTIDRALFPNLRALVIIKFHRFKLEGNFDQLEYIHVSMPNVVDVEKELRAQYPNAQVDTTYIGDTHFDALADLAEKYLMRTGHY